MPSAPPPSPPPHDQAIRVDPRLLDAALSALRVAPAGLLADLDGTLAPIVPNPATVVPQAGATEALAALARRLAVVGLLTGRAALDARRIVGLDTLLVAGNHGLEWLNPREREPQPDPRLAGLHAALERTLAALPALPGVSAEHKGLSATVHYRRAPDPPGARDAILAALRRALAADSEAPLAVREGRMSVELLPAAAGDKGTAVRRVVERYRLRGLVVLGDDRTDLDAFRAAADLRARGGLRAFTGAVRASDEVPPVVAAGADAVVGSPVEVVALLTELAARLDADAVNAEATRR
jgi:trehalose 6-phosphate phosphatase